MSGTNCAFPECTVSRTGKYQSIEIFKISISDDDFHVNSRNNILAILGRYRVMDKAVREGILTGKIYIWERHLKTEDIEFEST